MRIKNWKKYQHYGKYRQGMPWIKLYGKLLNDPEWFALSGDASKLLVGCWLIASEHNGELPPMKDIAFRLRMKLHEVEELIAELDHWFDKNASTVLADCEQDASTDRDRDRDVDKKEAALAGRYAFAGNVIKLNHHDHALWLKTYSDLDLDAELAARDAYLASLSEEERKRWMISTAAYLRNRQRELRAKAKKVMAPFKPFVREPDAPQVSPEERQRRFEEAQALTRRMRGDALVRSHDEKPERSPGTAATNGSGLRHLLSSLPSMDDAEEDQAERVDKAVSH